MDFPSLKKVPLAQHLDFLSCLLVLNSSREVSSERRRLLPQLLFACMNSTKPQLRSYLQGIRGENRVLRIVQIDGFISFPYHWQIIESASVRMGATDAP